MTYTTRTTCRSCDETSLSDVLSLGDCYLPTFVVARDEALPKAPLDLVRCDSCGLLQLRHETDPELLCRDYWYRSGINQTMRDALADVVLDGMRYSKEGVWLDIGANDGYLLSRVSERFTKIASEPALNMQPMLEEHADHIDPNFFTADGFLEYARHADVITSCACFYHVSEPDIFVHDVARCLADGGVWINQLSDAPTMLRLNALDSICHEHACYWDAHQLNEVYARHGLHIVSIKHNTVNGGSIRVAAMKAKNAGSSVLHGVAETRSVDVEAFADRVRRWKVLMTDLMDLPAVRSSPLWGIGASTKGSIAMQYLDMNDRFIALADRNPAKWGLQPAGVWVPILSEDAMRKAMPRFAVNWIWGFREEIIHRESALRSGGTTIIMPLPNPEFIL
jgi:hypothetical protein